MFFLPFLTFCPVDFIGRSRCISDNPLAVGIELSIDISGLTLALFGDDQLIVILSYCNLSFSIGRADIISVFPWTVYKYYVISILLQTTTVSEVRLTRAPVRVRSTFKLPVELGKCDDR